MLGTSVRLGNSARKVKIKNRISKESNMVTYPGHLKLANQDTNKHSSGVVSRSQTLTLSGGESGLLPIYDSFKCLHPNWGANA